MPSGAPTQQQDSRPQFKGLWHINLSEVEKYQNDKATDTAILTGESAPVTERDSLVRLAGLRAAHKELQSMNEQLTTDFLARSAVAPAHRAEHEEVIHVLLMEALYIRGKALKAHTY